MKTMKQTTAPKRRDNTQTGTLQLIGKGHRSDRPVRFADRRLGRLRTRSEQQRHALAFQ